MAQPVIGGNSHQGQESPEISEVPLITTKPMYSETMELQ